ncbi:unnamed protein product [Clonostachys rosea f. rosea IK726]|uniref:Uncharacterized protein n=1 Tax=Clonostachys rosea f. rosea IK726 TaxID=1349383 RepID=A0ACA9TY32_BIOOC|nr:unnamed protein product [Clonostachys rosea f. rosea IK726]
MALNQIFTGGIGLAAEAIKHQKNKKAAKNAFADHSISVFGTVGPSDSRQMNAGKELFQGANKISLACAMSTDKLHNDLDGFEKRPSVESGPSRAVIPKGVGKDPARISTLVEAFLAVHRPLVRQTPAPLPFAVIIPQRRPESRQRGFVPAYAPCLAPCGISEDAFMQFHEFYNESLRYSNAIKVVTVAAGAAGLVPSITATVVSLTIGAAAQTAASLQSRQRTNDFLSQMNLEYFMPMGLVCLVMSVDHGQMGDASMPLAAPLIFPKAGSGQDQDKSTKFQRAKQFIQDYGDRRAQAEFARSHPDSQLTKAVASQVKFQSFLGDPRNFSSVSMNSLQEMAHDKLTGQGTRFPVPQRDMRFRSRAQMSHHEGERLQHAGLDTPNPQSRERVDSTKDVLYMMIVPLPTQEQINSAYDEPPAYLETEEVRW